MRRDWREETMGILTVIGPREWGYHKLKKTKRKIEYITEKRFCSKQC